jgi:hypothetical protein
VIGKTALADGSKPSQRCPEPQQRKHGVRHPLIGTMQARREMIMTQIEAVSAAAT